MRRVAVVSWILLASACRREAPSTEPEVPTRTAEPLTYDGTPSPAAQAETSASRAEPERAAKARPPQTIYRSEVERALSRGPGYLLGQLGPEPFRVQGKFVGWEITRLFPDDPQLCDPCDLAVGDVILSINGDRLETPQAFAELVEKAPTLRAIEVRSLRADERRVVKYTIVDD